MVLDCRITITRSGRWSLIIVRLFCELNTQFSNNLKRSIRLRYNRSIINSVHKLHIPNRFEYGSNTQNYYMDWRTKVIARIPKKSRPRLYGITPLAGFLMKRATCDSCMRICCIRYPAFICISYVAHQYAKFSYLFQDESIRMFPFSMCNCVISLI